MTRSSIYVKIQICIKLTNLWLDYMDVITLFLCFSEPIHSPTAADRFSSPAPGSINAGSAKRRLFTCGPVPGSATGMATPAGSSSGTNESTASGSSTQPQQIITFQQAQTEDGTQVLIPVKIVGGTGGTSSSPKPGSTAPATAATSSTTANESAKPKRTGSLALLFRKVCINVAVLYWKIAGAELY